jgi:arabinogalactan oligomer/maltooligosaccharide transport system substrate-binding protein
VADARGVAEAHAFLFDLQSAGASFFANRAELTEAFEAGTVSLIVDDRRSLERLRRVRPGLAAAPLPSGPSGPARPLVGVEGWMVNPATADVGVAADVALALTNQAAGQVMADEAGQVPSASGVTIGDEVTSVFDEVASEGIVRPNSAQFAAAIGPFGDALRSVLDTDEDAEEAVKKACAAMDEANGL